MTTKKPAPRTFLILRQDIEWTPARAAAVAIEAFNDMECDAGCEHHNERCKLIVVAAADETALARMIAQAVVDRDYIAVGRLGGKSALCALIGPSRDTSPLIADAERLA